MIIDVRGLPCPEPLLKVKQFIDKNESKAFEILLDTKSSYENLSRFLNKSGVKYKEKKDNGCFVFSVSGETSDILHKSEFVGAESISARYLTVTVILSSDVIGNGNDELGRVLMHAFLKTLPEIKPTVNTLIFMNSGVKLLCGDSEFLKALENLESKGIKLLACGMCLDFFNLKDELKIGNITNMYEICEISANSDKLIKF